jgi:hypothetical protein
VSSPSRHLFHTMTRRQILDRADLVFAALWTRLQLRQEQHRTRRGIYQQFLPTGTPPADGTDATPDTSRRPHYQTEGWEVLAGDLPAVLPFAVRVDQYQSPEGAGYVLTVTLTILGRTLERTAQAGPLTWLAHDWQQMESSGGIAL